MSRFGFKWFPAALLLAAAACTDQAPSAPVSASYPMVGRVLVSSPSQALTVGQVQTVTATCYDSVGNVLPTRSIFWSSTVPRVATVSPTIATVSPNGVVTAKQTGTTVISAR